MQSGDTCDKSFTDKKEDGHGSSEESFEENQRWPRNGRKDDICDKRLTHKAEVMDDSQEMGTKWQSRPPSYT